MEFICMANSYKTGGRCVAGIDAATGNWIRPVSNPTSGELSLNETIVYRGTDSRPIKPLDLVEIGALRPCPTQFQPENVLRQIERWDFKQRVELKDLAQYTQQPGQLLGSNRDYVSCAEEPTNPQSLTLIQVKNPQFFPNPNKEWQLRTTFNFGDNQYQLAVTDDSNWAKNALRNPITGDTGNWLFTISLATPWAQDGDVENLRMYKLVAGAFALPNN